MEITSNQGNQFSILLKQNKKASSTKIALHFINDCVKCREINIGYMQSKDLIGDFFTVGLTESHFKSMRNSILNMEEENFHVYQKWYYDYVKKQKLEMNNGVTQLFHLEPGGRTAIISEPPHQYFFKLYFIFYITKGIIQSLRTTVTILQECVGF